MPGAGALPVGGVGSVVEAGGAGVVCPDAGAVGLAGLVSCVYAPIPNISIAPANSKMFFMLNLSFRALK